MTHHESTGEVRMRIAEESMRSKLPSLLLLALSLVASLHIVVDRNTVDIYSLVLPRSDL